MSIVVPATGTDLPFLARRLEAKMASLPIVLGLMSLGIALVAIGFRARGAHRLSLCFLGAASIVGPMAVLVSGDLPKKMLSLSGIALGMVSMGSSAVVLFHRLRELRRGST